MKETSHFRPTADQLKLPGETVSAHGRQERDRARNANWLFEAHSRNDAEPVRGPVFNGGSDVARFYQMVLNGGELDGKRVLSADAVSQMTSVQSGDLQTGFGTGDGWGLGFCVVREPCREERGWFQPARSATAEGRSGTQSWAGIRREA